MTIRKPERITQAFPAMDGDGVALKRNDLFDGRLDPFLMLDELKAEPSDAPNSFPVHPHRGIQTLSYLIHGKMQHQDSLGTQLEVVAGGLQWMHTGQGIEHSEKPGVDKQGLWGFQFWLNVPREEKYQAPVYQDVPAEQTLSLQQGSAEIKLLAGDWRINHQDYQAPFQKLSGQGALADIAWQAETELEIATDATSLALFIIEGQLQINGQQNLASGQLVQFGGGDQIQLNALGQARTLIFKGEPIGEPIVHRGPFVMTSEAEIKETIRAYQKGTLVPLQ